MTATLNARKHMFMQNPHYSTVPKSRLNAVFYQTFKDEEHYEKKKTPSMIISEFIF